MTGIGYRDWARVARVLNTRLQYPFSSGLSASVIEQVNRFPRVNLVPSAVSGVGVDKRGLGVREPLLLYPVGYTPFTSGFNQWHKD